MTLEDKENILLRKLIEVRDRESTKDFLDWRLENNSNKADIDAWKHGIKKFIATNRSLIIDGVLNIGKNQKYK
ncbi:hypothetical protein L9W92_11035 [Pelotomaculum terephthalicicum JT]|uniref:hypothetical protein n=1 Tax=Pelotomaculum TaxID=191373 RepID=UPI0009D39377|nr:MULTISPECIES: hypothetical protein [Pelotomaculum]MCG9968588.1 hypothetical protein [Pelotomaculum terephthalicicum JT]OPX84966.1 MAG: hypothetical protein A4E54_02696 [Pelotomaculum sp. PtaB.Bin117]OPY63799.1 MAG: hypothetical protein A4E56_00334 [Pelotomaculum sp. PtaU1.Bin065]